MQNKAFERLWRLTWKVMPSARDHFKARVELGRELPSERAKLRVIISTHDFDVVALNARCRSAASG